MIEARHKDGGPLLFGGKAHGDPHIEGIRQLIDASGQRGTVDRLGKVELDTHEEVTAAWIGRVLFGLDDIASQRKDSLCD